MWGRARFYRNWFFGKRFRYSGDYKRRSRNFFSFTRTFRSNSFSNRSHVWGTFGALTTAAILISPFVLPTVFAATGSSTVEEIYNEFSKVLETLNENISESSDPLNPILSKLSKISKEEFSKNKEKVMEMLINIPKIYGYFTWWEKVVDSYKVAFNLCKKLRIFDDEPHFVLHIVEDLSHTYIIMKKPEESKKICEQYLQLAKDLAKKQNQSENESPEVGHGYLLLGMAKSETNDIKGAKESIQKAIQIFDNFQFSSDTPKTQTELENIRREKIQSFVLLANLDQINNNIDSALANYERAYSLLQEIPKSQEQFDGMWPDKKEIEYQLYLNIARALSKKGDFDNAAEYAKKSVELAKMIYGDSSPEVSTLKMNWGIHLINANRADEAERVLEEVLNEYETQNRDSFDIQLVLGQIYEKKNDLEKAKSLYEKALQSANEHHRTDALTQAIIYYRLALLQENTGQFQNAEDHFRKAYDIFKKTENTEKYQIVVTNHLATLLSKRKQFEEAEKLFSEALRLSEKKIGKDSPYTVACLHNLGNFYQAWEKYDKAQKYYESSINLAIKIFGTENHDDVASSVQSLGYLFFLKEDYVNAQKSFERALKIHTALQNDNSQTVGYIHYHMGRIAHHLGDLKNALQRYEHSREIFEKSPEENEKMLVRLYTLIGDIHSLFGSTKEAQNCYEKAMIFVKGNPLFNDEEKKLLAEKIASLKKSIESNTQ